MDNAISSLVGEEFEGGVIATVAAPNGSLYGIPKRARQVAKFNPLDESITHIGPDFGDDDGSGKWNGGAITDSGVIYCPPYYRDRGILKIDTNTDNVTELDVDLLPERGEYMWLSCALALDGCVYFMPYNANRIMKLDPNNNDAMTSVGDDLGDAGEDFEGTVVGIDGCVYGISHWSSIIVKYDPINNIISFFEDEDDADLHFRGRGVLARDGFIYALGINRVLKINTTNNSYCTVGNTIQSDHGDPILGIDGCIYWPPTHAAQILKYDLHSNLTSLVGDDFGTRVQFKWSGGCAARDGKIYCLPYRANRILMIDPLKECLCSLKINMEQFPEQLGCIFKPSDDIPNKTNFDRAVSKFGLNKVLGMLDECMPPADQACAVSNLYPFMIAASYKSSNLSAIYHVLRQAPSLVSARTIASSDGRPDLRVPTLIDPTPFPEAPIVSK